MNYRMIATWKMAFEGVQQANALLAQHATATKAIETAIQNVENNPHFCSVGYGGLPNKEGIVELDSAFMNGNTLSYGAIMATHEIQNPISVAISLANRSINCVLAGVGAEEYAKEQGFAQKEMLTPSSKKRWQEKKEENISYKAYEGHDTVCAIAKDQSKNMAVGVSTSGLFMKESGRVGDSPIIGSGFYCDNEIGAVACTGLGEDIMRGCLSIRILNKIQEGINVQTACDQVLDDHIQRMKKTPRNCDAISIIAMDKEGNYGASTNIEAFPYVLINDQNQTEIHVASYHDQIHHNFIATPEWLQTYDGD